MDLSPPPLLITSLQNPRIKHVTKLRDRRPRDRAGRFIIEGYRGISRACDQQFELLELYISPELFKGVNEDTLIARCVAAGARIIQVPPHVFAKIAYRDKPEGLLAVAPQKRLTVADLPTPQKNSLFIIAEGIEKPGNLGTMLRSADATGVDAILLCDKRTDLFNPNGVRASTGALFSVPVAEDEPAVIADWLAAAGCQIVAATPHAARRYDQVDLTGPVAVAMGAEQYGLTDFWLQRTADQVRIPMMGMADSLNVATATTILLYEVLRQRMGAGLCVDPGVVEH